MKQLAEIIEATHYWFQARHLHNGDIVLVEPYGAEFYKVYTPNGVELTESGGMYRWRFKLLPLIPDELFEI